MSGVSAFSGLNLALRGLLAQQRALDVTGHNIANVETEGYSRQDVVLSAAMPLSLEAGQIKGGGGAQLGQGVDVLQYRRLRDDFVDLQWRSQNMTGGESDVMAQRLDQVQSAMGESSKGGISTLLSKFWSSAQSLADHPESDSARTALASDAKNLAGAFNAFDGAMAGVQAQATQRVTGLLSDQGPIKPMATELAKLNTQINQSVQAGQEPSDLKDRRDLLLDKLSRYGQISVSTDTTYPAMVNVTFAGATTPLVTQGTATMPTPADISATPGGELGGLNNVATTIAGYRSTLDGLAGSLASSVNTAHGSTIFNGTTAASLSVTLPVTINAGSTGAKGANDLATAMAALKGGAVDQGWANFVTKLGSDVASAEGNQETSTRVLDSLTAQRTSTSGVSLDEEMTNMLRYQRGYQAAARVMNTMDETLDQLINRVGKVGL